MKSIFLGLFVAFYLRLVFAQVDDSSARGWGGQRRQRRGANGSPGSFELFDKTKNMVDVESSNEIMKRESGDRKAKDF